MFAGGCVRDRLLGRVPKDYDIATSAHPEAVTAILESAGLRVIPTGLAYGTVTVVTSLQHVEVTTLRRDIVCHGRHAEVIFDGNFENDAQRRDFTVNALFEDMDGEVVDYVGGIDDLRQCRLRFVGDADARLTEDALRSFRYVRLLAQLGWRPQREEIDALFRAAERTKFLSKERVLQECRSILASPGSVPAVDLLMSTQLLVHGLGWWNGDGRRLKRILKALLGQPASDLLALIRDVAFFRESMGWSRDLKAQKRRLMQLPLARRTQRFVHRISECIDLELDMASRVRAAMECGPVLSEEADGVALLRILQPDLDRAGQISSLICPRAEMPSLAPVIGSIEVSQRTGFQLLARIGWTLRWWSDLGELERLLANRDHLVSLFLELGWAITEIERILLRQESE